MPLVIDNESTGWKEWRYWCECMSEDHVLKIWHEYETVRETGEKIGKQTWIGIACRPQGMSFWERIKAAWWMLTQKQDFLYTDFLIEQKDRKELADVLHPDMQP